MGGSDCDRLREDEGRNAEGGERRRPLERGTGRTGRCVADGISDGDRLEDEVGMAEGCDCDRASGGKGVRVQRGRWRLGSLEGGRGGKEE
eukprot:971786-Pyramimonas_sp.AAC.1